MGHAALSPLRAYKNIYAKCFACICFIWLSPFRLHFNELKAERSSPEFHLASIAQEIARCRAAEGDLAAVKPQPQRGTAMADPSSAHTLSACGDPPVPAQPGREGATLHP